MYQLLDPASQPRGTIERRSTAAFSLCLTIERYLTIKFIPRASLRLQSDLEKKEGTAIPNFCIRKCAHWRTPDNGLVNRNDGRTNLRHEEQQTGLVRLTAPDITVDSVNVLTYFTRGVA